jgi:predicted acyltransferase
MGETPLATKSERLMSLDVFRGMTILLMIMVNNPGSWGSTYGPLKHAPWDGWTPTDFVFPFFLFIVGVAMTFSFDRRLKQKGGKMRLFEQVCRRTTIIFLLGMILTGFPNFRLIGPYLLMIAGLGFLFANEPIMGWGNDDKSKRNKLLGWGVLVGSILWFLLDFGHFQGPVRSSSWGAMFPLSNDIGGGIIRIPGVLQRIALCYFFASLIVMFTSWKGRLAWALLLINLYWLIMRYIPAPAGYEIGVVEGLTRDAPAGAPYAGALNDWIDVKLMGQHLYSHRPDPEGLLSTIPSIATVLFGVLTGNWLHHKRDKMDQALGMFIGGSVLLILGACMDYYFPINKKIWTSSYVVFMAGWCLVILSICFYIADVKKIRRVWTWPFMVYGTNAIFIFFLSGLAGRMIGSMIKFTYEGETWALKSWIYKFWFTNNIADPKLASFAYAVFYILLWLILTWPLYRNKIFIKV